MKTIKVNIDVKCADEFDMNRLIDNLRKALVVNNVESSKIEYNENWYDVNECFEKE